MEIEIGGFGLEKREVTLSFISSGFHLSDERELLVEALARYERYSGHF